MSSSELGAQQPRVRAPVRLELRAGPPRAGHAAVDSHNKQSAERIRRALGPAPADLQDLRCAQARAALIASDPALAAGPSPVLHLTNAAGSLQATAADYARSLTAFTGLHARPLLGAPESSSCIGSA